MNKYTMHRASVLDWATAYTGPKYHALLCDPPYHMTEMHKRFGKPGSAPAQYGTDGAFARQARGFMGKNWDGGTVAFEPETWFALAEHLHPGAFGMAFASSRGWHRMAVAIEDAGLIIHPSMFGWSYGCLSEDTEILTSNGWEPYHKAIENTPVMCYNPDTDALEWHRVQELVTYDYDETAYRIHSANTDQIVSRNHRCIVRRGGQWVFRYAETLQAAEIVPVLESMPRVRRVVRGRKLRRVSQKDMLFARMCRESLRRQAARSHVQTAQPARLASTRPAQGRNDHLSGLRRIEVETGRMAPQGRHADMLQKVQRSATIARTRQTLRERQGHEATWQGIIWSEQSSLEGRRNLFQETRQLYGREIHPLPGRVCEYGAQGWLRHGASAYGRTGDRSSAAALRSGTPQRPQPRSQRTEQLPTIREQSRPQTLRTSRIARSDLATVTPIHYRGLVWCVRVPTGAFVARRNGKIFITGNSGFPKATRPDVQIDRRRGNDRAVVGTRKHAPKFDAKGHGYREKDNGFNSRERETFDVTEPASDESAAWSGHRYGLQCIKPALEPIIVFQKPYSRAGAVADMLQTGAGAIWIDGGRIAGEPWSRNNKPGQNGAFNASGGPNSNDMGRWPSNLLLIHTPRCDADGCADDCPVARLGAQSGERNSSKSGGEYGTYRQNDHGNDVYRRGLASAVPNRPPIGDTGTAARYFFQADYVLDRMEEADPVYYCAKASRAEREAGLDPRTVAFMRDLDDSDDDAPTFDEVTVDDGRKKSIDNAYQRGETKRRNPHPTVKPLSLSRYLATLLLPPERYAPRRLLIPFAGVGSELIGGLLAGWDEIDGIELDEDGTHIPVANARISYWTARRAELADPSKPITVKAAPRVPAGQLDMFVKEGP